MTKYVDINDPNKYVPCHKRSYTIYACIPAVGTVVINKLEQAASINALKGKSFFTISALNAMRESNKPQYEMLMSLVQQGQAYRTTMKCPVVLCETVGELRCISLEAFTKQYRLIQDNTPVAISQSILDSKMKDDMMDWVAVHVGGSQVIYGCCEVPVVQRGTIQTVDGKFLWYNAIGVSHGSGDFIVSRWLQNNRPDMTDRWVVNGDVFLNTYKCKQLGTNGVASSKSITLSDLPRLVER